MDSLIQAAKARSQAEDARQAQKPDSAKSVVSIQPSGILDPTQTNTTQDGDEKTKRLEILNTDILFFSNFNGRPIRKLIGHVALRQDSTDFFCDSAYHFLDSNVIEAFRNVKVVMSDSVTMRGEHLFYESKTKLARLFTNIVLRDGETILETNRLNYYRGKNFAKYFNGGTITNGDNILRSTLGYYHPDDQMAYFKGDVRLENPNYDLFTDTLGYDTKSETAVFHAPTWIYDEKDNKIYTERGFYDTHLNLAYFYQNPKIRDSTYQLTADTIYYDRQMDYGRAFGKLRLEKLDSSINVYSNYGEFRQLADEVLLTEEAYAVQIMDTDTLYLFADTLFTGKDSVKNLHGSYDVSRYLFAWNQVSFFMREMQGKADSLVYLLDDSLITFFKSPLLWSEQTQLHGDTIFVWMENNRVDSMKVGKDAFVITEESPIGFNQVKGKWLHSKFSNNKLQTMWIRKSSESIYYIKEEKGDYSGMNKAQCQNMEIHFKDNKPNKILFVENPVGTFYPIDFLSEDLKQLEGFDWRPLERPLRPNGEEIDNWWLKELYVPDEEEKSAGEEKENDLSD